MIIEYVQAYNREEQYYRKKQTMGFRNNGGDFAPREMHNVKCSDCGKDTQVPFKPKEGRPVYCRDCYQKHKKF